MSKFLLHAILRGFDNSRENQYFDQPFIKVSEQPVFNVVDRPIDNSKIVRVDQDAEVSYISCTAPVEDCPSSLSVIEDYLKSK